MQHRSTKRTARVTPKELLQRLLSAEGLDQESREEYLRLLALDDENEHLRGVSALLEKLCRLGRLRKLSTSHADGVTNIRYRNLSTLDTISISVPRRESPVQETERGASDAASPRAESHVETEGGVDPGRTALAEASVRAETRAARALLPRSILEAVAASSRSIDLAGAMGYLYDLLTDVVGCDGAAIFMSAGLSGSPAGKLSELEEVFRWSERDMIAPSQLKATVEETGQCVSMADLSESGTGARPRSENAHGSLVVAPLRAEAYVYGTLEVWSERSHAFTSDDVAIIDFVSEFMGGLIKRRLEIEELIFVDQTSQIHNRRYFDEQLSREVERCKRTGNAMALLIADLDDFKQVNDTMGHAAGDSVLRQVGRIMSENARQLDIVARIGGEEFGVILPNVERDTATAVAERMRGTVQNHRFVTGVRERPTCELTMSMGGALYPLDAKSRADLMDKADRIALYEAKRRGKNRVVFWQDVQES